MPHGMENGHAVMNTGKGSHPSNSCTAITMDGVMLCISENSGLNVITDF